MECHDLGGIAPPHSVENVAESYVSILSYLDFNDLMKSTLIKKFQAKHWEPWGGQVDLSLEELLTGLKLWWNDGQQSCPNVGNHLSTPVSIPSNLKVEESTLLKFSLPGFEPAQFQIEVVGKGSQGKVDTYQLWKPRLITPNKTYFIDGVHLLENGHSITGAKNFQYIRATVNASYRGPILSSSYELLLKRRDQTLQIAIDQLTEAQPKNCHQTELFEKNVLPTLKKYDCFSCHSGSTPIQPGTPAAKSAFNMALPLDELCKASLQRVNGKLPERIPLISLPLGHTAGHEWVIPFPEEVFPSWTDWIEKETL